VAAVVRAHCDHGNNPAFLTRRAGDGAPIIEFIGVFCCSAGGSMQERR